jgi:hypothetical protein
MLAAKNNLAGDFQERDHGHWFSYALTADEWALANGLPHEIDTIDGVRFARVLKTCVYVAVDEAADGTAVLQRWALRRNNRFTR